MEKINGTSGSEVVKAVPKFVQEADADERILSGMEQAVLRDRARGMGDLELRYFLQFIKTDYMVEELARRDAEAHGILADVREKTFQISSSMSTDDLLELINEIRNIVTIGGQNYVKKG